ncbi:MAG TPA: S-adenosylmethionine decarboxylase [Gemmatimonadales bacterium]|nr:S-adenosylmethionine decarboxylase [Gemmatimonadales bacterium]
MSSTPSGPGHLLTELTDLPAARLTDTAALSAAVISAGAALGLAAYGTPIVREGPMGTAVVLLAHRGHLVLHTDPAAGRCLVDILLPGNSSPERGIEVMTRRLGARP